MNVKMIVLMIMVSAICTLFLRALPFLAFNGKRQMPEKLKNLGAMLPSTIIAVLIVYCLKDMKDDWSGIGIAQMVAVVVTVVSFKWKHSTFISILAGTVCYMVLLRIL